MPLLNEFPMPVFQIDGEPVEYEPGEKVLSAALRCGKNNSSLLLPSRNVCSRHLQNVSGGCGRSW